MAIFVSGLFFLGGYFLVGLFFNKTPSKSIANTNKNFAISGCIAELRKQNLNLSETQLNSYCQCSMNQIEKLNPTIWTDAALVEDKIKKGLTINETNAIVNNCKT